MPPPDLPRDAPRADVVHPVEVDAREPLGREADAALLDRGDRRRGELVHRHPPLQHDQRLDLRPAALAGRDRVAIRLLALEQPALLRPAEDALAGLPLGQPGQLARIGGHPPVQADDRRLGQAVVAADLEVRRVVARRHLERAGSELRLDALVRDHRHAPLHERHDHLAADEVAVALVVRMDCDGDVGEDRRRADGRDRDVAVPVGERVADVRERVVGL